MCGFVGQLSFGGMACLEKVERMSAVQWHRGPDDSGTFARGPIAFGFRRLSILDLSPAGHQPFLDEEKSLALVYNGEIFNYLELRDELAALGHQFRSSSDTEVLLAAYAEWGTECLTRLNGMWSFLIADFRRGFIFGSRDRFGIKPMYSAVSGSSVFFASEIKALRAGNLGFNKIAWPLASRFLAEGRLDNFPTGGATFFEGISEIAPAHAFTVAFDGTQKHWRYWSIPESDGPQCTDPPARLCELLEDSVRVRLRSDVPVGVTLSGGMDSSSILAFMHRLSGVSSEQSELHAFSYMPQEFSEESYIASSIAQTGATLHRTAKSPSDTWDSLSDVLKAHDEPLHSPTALAGYQVYQLAAQHGVRVLLSGQGADESLGGYPPYFSDSWIEGLASPRAIKTVREILDFSRGHNTSFATTLFAAVKRLVLSSVSPYRGQRDFRAPNLGWLSPDIKSFLPDKELRYSSRGLRGQLVRAMEQQPLPLFLRVEDRNSMAHSIEARLPFLDNRLVTLAFQLANEWKVNGRWNKYALREAMKGVMPENVRTRVDKMGFPTGFSEWIRGPLRTTVEQQLHDPSFDRMNVFDAPRVRQAFADHVAGKQDNSLAVFHALQFHRWHDEILKQPVQDMSEDLNGT